MVSASHFFLAGSFFIQPQEWSKTLPVNPRGYFPPLIPNLFVFLPVLRWREEGQIEMVFMWSSLSPSCFFWFYLCRRRKFDGFWEIRKKNGCALCNSCCLSLSPGKRCCQAKRDLFWAVQYMKIRFCRISSSRSQSAITEDAAGKGHKTHSNGRIVSLLLFIRSYSQDPVLSGCYGIQYCIKVEFAVLPYSFTQCTWFSPDYCSPIWQYETPLLLIHGLGKALVALLRGQ